MPTEPPPVPAPARTRPGNATLILLTGAAAIVVVIGAFLPWATAFGLVAVNGIDADGVITLILAIIGVVFAAWGAGMLGGAPGKAALVPIVLLVLGAIVALIAIIDTVNVQSTFDGAASDLVSVGAGLWLTLVAGIAWLALAIVALVRR